MSGARPLRVVVIGAGVAGGAFALRLAQQAGHRVEILLLERAAWPRAKVCGCCLNEAALECLDELGLGEACRDRGAPVNAVRLIAPGRSATVAKRPGLALLRSELDVLLVDHACALGVRFESQSAGAVSSAPIDHQSPVEVRVRTPAGDRTIEADVVIAGDGLGAASVAEMPEFAETIHAGARFGVGGVLPAHASGEAAHPARGVIDMHVGRHGYVGLVRLRDESVNLAAALDPAWTRTQGGPAPAMTTIIREAGSNIDLSLMAIRGTPLLTRRRALVASRRVLLIGDSAGYVEPFTGEGMAWGLAGALRCAELVSTAVIAGRREHWSVAPCDEWNRWHRHDIVSRQRACARLKPLLRSPLVTRVFLGAMDRLPLARAVASKVARNLERSYFPRAALASVSTGANNPWRVAGNANEPRAHALRTEEPRVMT